MFESWSEWLAFIPSSYLSSLTCCLINGYLGKPWKVNNGNLDVTSFSLFCIMDFYPPQAQRPVRWRYPCAAPPYIPETLLYLSIYCMDCIITLTVPHVSGALSNSSWSCHWKVQLMVYLYNINWAFTYAWLMLQRQWIKHFLWYYGWWN